MSGRNEEVSKPSIEFQTAQRVLGSQRRAVSADNLQPGPIPSKQHENLLSLVLGRY